MTRDDRGPSLTGFHQGKFFDEGLNWQRAESVLAQLVAPAVPTEVFLTYWRFAVERQNILIRRQTDSAGPWTADPILRAHRFTNAYRAEDRVSQYLIKEVQYSSKWSEADLFLRTLFFKIFNRIDTWELVRGELGEICNSPSFLANAEKVLDRAKAANRRIYSAAYIMPSGGGRSGFRHKHRMHLWLIGKMLKDDLPRKLADSDSLECAFKLLVDYHSIGDFLGYQFATDLNYSRLMDHSEMEFVVAGPGAREGIAKCFSHTGDKDTAWIIKRVAEIQSEAFSSLGLKFPALVDRPLQLIDCQNLFCEVAKYSRLRHPSFNLPGGRIRIKQKFSRDPRELSYFFPPKWKTSLPKSVPHVAHF